MAEEQQDVVVVTGFGPFGGYMINASWEVAKTLSTLNVEEELDIKLIIEEIPVTYESVAEKVPVLWTKHNPMLVVHMGVSCMATDLTLESLAHNSGYSRHDVNGKLPHKGKCCQSSVEKIKPSLNLKNIINVVNNSNIDVTASVSKCAGRYLCEFIYYTSLSINNTCTLFIHVPDIDQPYTAEQLAKGVKKILTVIINEIRKNNDVTSTENCVCVELAS